MLTVIQDQNRTKKKGRSLEMDTVIWENSTGYTDVHSYSWSLSWYTVPTFACDICVRRNPLCPSSYSRDFAEREILPIAHRITSRMRSNR